MKQAAQVLAARTRRPVPPGPRGQRLLGSLLDVRRDKIRFVSAAARDYGDVVLFRMGPKRLYLLSHPNAIQHVLHDNAGNYVKGIGLEQARVALGEGILTSEGERWATQHESLRHLFTRGRLDAWADTIARTVDERIERWRPMAGMGPVDVAGEAVGLTLDVLGRTLFGADLEGLGDRFTPALDEVVRWSMRRMVAILPLPASAPTPGNLRCRRAARELERIADEIVERWRAAPAREGFLSALLADPKLCADRPLLRQEILSLLLAGHETTATALSWCCHLLATHPEAQSRLREEVRRVRPDGAAPTAADLPRLPYTRMVLEETLRLYPSVWMITRRAVAGDEIDGYEVPAGSDLLISVYTLHRHPGFWEAPEAFRPERFAADPGHARPSHAYLPFGLGARACLGRGFAFLELTLAVSRIVRSFELVPDPGRPVEPEPLLTLRPLGGLFQHLMPV
jgi:enediyne biosynthesis protein E7